MLNIVIPMAGRGSRFAVAGYQLPKPLIEVCGKPMIQVVVENLAPRRPHQFIFICQSQHIKEYALKDKLNKIAPGSKVIGIDEVTAGQVCTVLIARALIDNDQPLMTANSDQYIDFDINHYLDYMDERHLDGLIMTMTSNDSKWSFARLNNSGYVLETAEKKPISEHATVGIYNFRKGRDLVRAADRMIKDGVRVNGEFYICPCYNYLIAEQKKIGVFGIGREKDGMYGLGTPEDLDFFLQHPVSSKV